MNLCFDFFINIFKKDIKNIDTFFFGYWGIYLNGSCFGAFVKLFILLFY